MTLSWELSHRITGFVNTYGGGDAGSPVLLAGDASGRRYFRVPTGAIPSSTVVMELPAPSSAIPGLPTTRGVTAPSSLGPQLEPTFLPVQRFLSEAAYPVPQISCVQLDRGFIGLEDLGDVTLDIAQGRASAEGRRALYRQAVSLIADLQRIGAEAIRSKPGFLAFHRRFDVPLLSWELDHFRDWFLERERGIRLDPAEAMIVDAAFSFIANHLAEQPPVLVHRDFQSRNLMVQGACSLRVIDFQDMLLGPPCYDLVALLKDSYVVLSGAETTELITQFAEEAGISNRNIFSNLFHIQTVQRKLKDAGRFIYLDRVREQSTYRRWIASSLAHAALAMAAVDELAPLCEVLGRHVPELCAERV